MFNQGGSRLYLAVEGAAATVLHVMWESTSQFRANFTHILQDFNIGNQIFDLVMKSTAKSGTSHKLDNAGNANSVIWRFYSENAVRIFCAV